MDRRPTLKKRWKLLRLKITGELLGLVFRGWRRSLRCELRGVEWLDGTRRSVIAIWHGRLHPCLLAVGRPGMLTMVSRSSDGEVATRVARALGLGVVRGSSKRGGAQALTELALQLEKGPGWAGALTVDGPRGPVAQPKRGVIELARQLSVPILPVTATGRPYLSLGTWDTLMVVAPFARVVAQIGPPLTVEPGMSDEEATAELKLRLDRTTAALDVELHGRSLWPHS